MQSPNQKNYKNAVPILVAVDNVIFGYDQKEGKLKVLIFERQTEPHKGNWSLIGSFIQNNESALNAAQRILEQFTGLSKVYLEQYNTYSDINRDHGNRVISIAFYSLIRLSEENRDLIKTYRADWFDLDSLPDLVLDHNQLVADALVLLQEKAINKPFVFNLLPEKFTLPLLHIFYQELYQKKIDDRNFRKKILATGVLDRLSKKDKSTSRKGSFLYQFNSDKYEKILKDGKVVQLL